MKHVTYAHKSLLVGDEAADVMLEYAASLASARLGDTVTLNAISGEGQLVDATFLLDTGAPIMAETANSELTEPDNAAPIEYMRLRIMELASSVAASPENQRMANSYEDLDLQGFGHEQDD
jgi:hypothetical protein